MSSASLPPAAIQLESGPDSAGLRVWPVPCRIVVGICRDFGRWQSKFCRISVGIRPLSHRKDSADDPLGFTGPTWFIMPPATMNHRWERRQQQGRAQSHRKELCKRTYRMISCATYPPRLVRDSPAPPDFARSRSRHRRRRPRPARPRPARPPASCRSDCGRRRRCRERKRRRSDRRRAAISGRPTTGQGMPERGIRPYLGWLPTGNRLASAAGPWCWRAKFGHFRPQSGRKSAGVRPKTEFGWIPTDFWLDCGRKWLESRRQWSRHWRPRFRPFPAGIPSAPTP